MNGSDHILTLFLEESGGQKIWPKITEKISTIQQATSKQQSSKQLQAIARTTATTTTNIYISRGMYIFVHHSTSSFFSESLSTNEDWRNYIADTDNTDTDNTDTDNTATDNTDTDNKL